MRRYYQPIPNPHTHHPPILKLQLRRPLQHQHKLILLLLIPPFLRRGMPPGNNPFNMNVVGFDQGFEQFLWQVFGDVLKQIVFHCVWRLVYWFKICR
jgi:hypothetical protein